MSNSSDPDQAQHSFTPELDPNCLQRSTADHKIRQLRLFNIQGHVTLKTNCPSEFQALAKFKADATLFKRIPSF